MAIRYPKSGKGNKWTIVELKAIGPDWRGETLSDGGGLYGEVMVSLRNTVSIKFKYSFRLGEKTPRFYCGTYPHRDLGVIRELRDSARDLVKQGMDPRVKKVVDKIEGRKAAEAVLFLDEQRKAEELTIKNMFDVWIVDGVSRKDGNKYIKQTFSKYIIPAIGEIEVRKLGYQDLLKIYKKLVADGKNATAFELSKDFKQMMVWAEKRKPWRSLMLEGNPAELVEIHKILPLNFSKERDRVLSVEEIRALKNVFDGMSQIYDDASKKCDVERPLKKEVQHAVWICLSALTRISETLKAEWKDIDFDRRTWLIPAENTKKVGKGKQTDHIIYLSDFTLNQFKLLHGITGDVPWVFPAKYKDGPVCEKSASKQIGDRQVKFKSRTRKLQGRVETNSLVIGNEKWTPHDMRRTGATMMQQLDIHRDVINLCQHHAVGSKIDRHYLLHDFKDKQEAAWRILGERLHEILN